MLWNKYTVLVSLLIEMSPTICVFRDFTYHKRLASTFGAHFILNHAVSENRIAVGTWNIAVTSRQVETKIQL